MESDENDLDNLFEEHETEERFNTEETADNNQDDANNANESQTAERIPVPKRIVKNPRLKFNADRLCGERGIPILINHFKDVKFKGKGHEVEDLNKLMSHLEHWCHRLFPSMTFGDCLRQIEKLGKKRPVQTCLRKIRLDMPILHNDFVRDDDENPDNVPEELDVEIPSQDAFDKLLVETGKSQLASTPLPVKRQTAGQILGTSFGSTLTEEQRKRMEYNKQLAAERRKAKLEAMQSNSANLSNQREELFSSIQGPLIQTGSKDIEITSQNTVSVNSNLKINEVSTKGAILSSSQLETPLSPSVINNTGEELGLDDLVDLVDEDEEPQIIEDNGVVPISFEKHNQPIEVIDLANTKVRNPAIIEVVNLEKDDENSHSASTKPIEIISLDTAESNKPVEVIRLDNAKTRNFGSRSNSNLELINLDSEEETTSSHAKRFKKDEVILREKETIKYDGINDTNNSDSLEMDTDDIHTHSVSTMNTIKNSRINPFQTEVMID